MKPVCLICARGGSRGIPNKNIRIINKKPLIAHTIEKAINSKIFSHVIVSTEDKKIARISKNLGAEIPFIRPKNLATGTIPVGDVFLHAIKKLQTLEYEFDTFVNSTVFDEIGVCDPSLLTFFMHANLSLTKSKA